jgi:hypothetical protein
MIVLSPNGIERIFYATENLFALQHSAQSTDCTLLYIMVQLLLLVTVDIHQIKFGMLHGVTIQKLQHLFENSRRQFTTQKQKNISILLTNTVVTVHRRCH